MFIKRGTVKVDKPVPVSHKVRRHPVQNHPDSVAVHGIDKHHELFGRAVTRSRRKIARHLIAPGTLKRILRHRHQFHMGVVHFDQILRQFIRRFRVCQRTVLLFHFPPPRSQMHFIDRDRRIMGIFFMTRFHPLFILPAVFLQRPDTGSGFGGFFGIKCVRIAFMVYNPAYFRFDVIFIGHAFGNIFDEPFPDTAFVFAQFQRVFQRVVTVEVSFDTDIFCIGRPDGEIDTALSFTLCQMCTEFFV